MKYPVMTIATLCSLFLLFPLSSAAAQEAGTEEAAAEESAGTAEEEAAAGEETAGRKLPTGFGQIRLGMEMETVKERLKRDSNFNFRGDPDVSMLREPNNALIQCRGYDFIERAAFQFVEDGLYTITLILNRELLGFYTMFSDLQEKYGRPDKVTPNKMQWESDAVLLTLERPLRVKYLRREVLDTLREESRRAKSLEEISRDKFLEQF